VGVPLRGRALTPIPHGRAILEPPSRGHAEVVVLDLVQPLRAGRRLRGVDGQARRDEARPAGHVNARAWTEGGLEDRGEGGQCIVSFRQLRTCLRQGYGPLCAISRPSAGVPASNLSKQLPSDGSCQSAPSASRVTDVA
jgi:hypothetical protein